MGLICLRQRRQRLVSGLACSVFGTLAGGRACAQVLHHQRHLQALAQGGAMLLEAIGWPLESAPPLSPTASGSAGAKACMAAAKACVNLARLGLGVVEAPIALQ